MTEEHIFDESVDRKRALLVQFYLYLPKHAIFIYRKTRDKDRTQQNACLCVCVRNVTAIQTKIEYSNTIGTLYIHLSIQIQTWKFNPTIQIHTRPLLHIHSYCYHVHFFLFIFERCTIRWKLVRLHTYSYTGIHFTHSIKARNFKLQIPNIRGTLICLFK